MCSEGWDPLCKFLGVPVPDEPFPHKNKGGNIVESATEEFPIFRKVQREILLSSVMYGSVALVAGVCVYKYGLTRILHRVEDCVEQISRKIGF